MVSFYYDDYIFEKEKNYLVYYRGNFGPPTRGHFSTIQKFIREKGVYYLVSQIGSERRHGVPYKTNRRIFKMYIDNLLDNAKDKIILKRMTDSMEVLEAIESFKKRGIIIHKVLFVRGLEWDTSDRRIKEEKEAYMEHLYRRLIRKLKEKEILLDFCFLTRDIENMSATKFVETLLKVTNRKNMSDRNFRNLCKYLPKGLPEEVSRKAISLLLQYSLK